MKAICGNCNSLLTFSNSKANSTIKCPNCHSFIKISESSNSTQIDPPIAPITTPPISAQAHDRNIEKFSIVLYIIILTSGVVLIALMKIFPGFGLIVSFIFASLLFFYWMKKSGEIEPFEMGCMYIAYFYGVLLVTLAIWFAVQFV